MLRSLLLRSSVVCRYPSVECPWARSTVTQTCGRGSTVTPVPLLNALRTPLLPAFKGVFLVCIDGHVTRLVQEPAHEKSEVCLERRSFVGVLKLSLQKAIVLRTYRCHRVKQRLLCVHVFANELPPTSFT